MLTRSSKQAGDTLIEVLLAFTIFGMAATVAMSTMNNGFSDLFVSNQRSQVQALMNGQLSILQAVHDAEAANPTVSTYWEDLLVGAEVGAGDIDAPVNGDGCTYSTDKNRLYFRTTSGGLWKSPLFISSSAPVTPFISEGIPTPDGHNMWMEVEKEIVVGGRDYYNFYIKACWYSGGQQQQSKSVLRLYDFLDITYVPISERRIV